MENNKIILVTGATGKQGGAVVRHLLKNNFRVRALTRNIESSAAKELKDLGVDLVQGDMNNTNDLMKATENMYGVYSVQNYWEKGVGYEGEVKQGKLLADAAYKNGIQHYVQASVADADKAKGVKHWECKDVVEKYIDKLGLPRTFFGETIFMENTTDPKMGRTFFPFLSGTVKDDVPLHLLATDDIGGIAAEVFKNPTAFIGKKLDIASDVLTISQLRDIYEKVNGKKISKFKVPSWLVGIMTRDGLRQLKWNNAVGWRFEIDSLKKIYPNLTTWEMFIRERNVNNL